MASKIKLDTHKRVHIKRNLETWISVEIHMNEIQTILKSVPENAENLTSNIYVDHNGDGYCGCDYGLTMEVTYYVPKTTEEIEDGKREAEALREAAKVARLRKEEEERALYESLKAKFEKA